MLVHDLLVFLVSLSKVFFNLLYVLHEVLQINFHFDLVLDYRFFILLFETCVHLVYPRIKLRDVPYDANPLDKHKRHDGEGYLQSVHCCITIIITPPTIQMA